MISSQPVFMGHSPSAQNPEWQTLKAHVDGVTTRLTHHVRYLNVHVPEVMVYARLTGLLHDLGKYRLEFQHHRLGWNPEARKPGEYVEKAVPHSDAGAKFMQGLLEMDRETASELPFVIANHHGRLRDVEALAHRLSESNSAEVEALVDLAVQDCPELGELLHSELPDLPLEGTERAFLIRLLLGALVDADRLDTEEHGSPDKAALRRAHQAEQAEMGTLLARLETEQARFTAQDAQDPQPINALRREMYTQALDRADLPPGFFRLTLPTGGGKTLTSLAFGLKHAQAHGLRRVIYAVPFTTIIDQTARVFRSVLEREGEFKVLEHHSNLEVRQQPEGRERQTTAPELATENWDAPVIVTTTVRLFQETLFGTRTAQLRRLHNVSGSVIVLDEAQSLPAHLLTPTLDALSFLVKYAGCSVVLCTATQPALDERLGFPALKGVRDLVPEAERYFDALRRVDYEFRITEPTPWPALAEELGTHDQVLCIVNTRQHAHDLYVLLGDDPGHFHLSTNMPPAHRKRELAAIRERLSAGLPCRVVSTQLIEAGIDVDFPRVYRAVGPLEAIVQAAGRCNREGKLESGRVVVFLPEDHKLPRGDYEVRESLARTEVSEGASLHDPNVFTPYFCEVYGRVRLAPEIEVPEPGRTVRIPFQTAHERLDFERVAQAYRMIADDTVPVVVRKYDEATVNRALGGQMTKEAWRSLQQFTVSVYRHKLAELQRLHLLKPVPELVRRAEFLDIEPPEIYEWTGQYHDRLGLVAEVDLDSFNL